MIEALKTFSAEVQEAKQRLDIARRHLKDSYVGLDEIIDRICDLVAPWLAGGWQVQATPTVICLWGLTGTGKTDLVEHLSQEFLPFPFTKIELGRYVGDMSFPLEGILYQSVRHLSGLPQVFLLDEFQHARTLMDDIEISRPKAEALWSLLNTGIVSVEGQNDDNIKLVSNLPILIQSVKLMREGKPVPPAIYNTICWALEEEDKKFISLYLLERLIDATGSWQERQELIEQFVVDDLGTLELLWDRLQKQKNTIPCLDFSKSLIFITGNIDEAYYMAGDISGKLRPEQLEQLVQGITPPQVMQALLRRFRPEQVARLGSNHILFPSLSWAQYQELTRREAAKLASNLKEKGINLQFSTDVYQKVLKIEGTWPTQGVRYILSAFRRFIVGPVMSCVTKILANVCVDEVPSSLPVDVSLEYVVEKEIWQIVCRAKLGEGKDISVTEPLVSSILQCPITQAIKSKKEVYRTLAIHEASHAVVYYKVFHEVPLEVSLWGDMPYSGCVLFLPEEKGSLLQERLKKLLMVRLAGWAAEQEFVSKEQRFPSSYDDLARVTEDVIRFYNEGNNPWGIYIHKDSHHPGACLFTGTDEANIRKIVSSLLLRTRRLVKKNKKEILALAAQLLQSPLMGQAELQTFFTSKQANGLRRPQ